MNSYDALNMFRADFSLVSQDLLFLTPLFLDKIQ